MKIAVLGCGNMASAIVECIGQNFKEINFLTYTPSFIKAQTLADKVDGHAVKDLEELVKQKDSISYWIIGCKPQQLDLLSKELGDEFSDCNIISILASKDIKELSNKLRTKKIFRVMPNTPSKLGRGISLVISSSGLDESKTDELLNMFEALGSVVVTKSEEELDELTVLTGSGPGIVFQFANMLSKSYEDMGYDQKVIRGMINQLFIGSAALMESENESSLTDLVGQVTSKGGVTIEFVNEMERQNVPCAVSDSLSNALKRGRELKEN